GALAFAIVGLSIAAARLYDAWQNRIGVAKDAFDAATLSAKAFMSAERATLSVQINSETVADLVGKYAGSDRSVGTLSTELAAPGLAYSFRNIGRTAAILKELSNHLVLQPESPPAADYRIRETMPEDLVVEAGKTSAVLGCLMEDAFTVEKAVDFQNWRSAFWFYGHVKFEDAFGRAHEWRWRFCYRRGYDRFRLVYYPEIPDRPPTPAPPS